MKSSTPRQPLHPARASMGIFLWAVTAAACAAPAGPAAMAPIKVGAVSSLTGPAPFPESTQAARAYFDSINASGGIRGRQIKLIVEDDGGVPAAAQAAALRLDREHGVLAHVGSASIVDCSANAAHYRERGIVSVQGTGVESSCFSSSHIAPVNTGPYLSLYTALQFAASGLRANRICAFIWDIPGMRMRPAYEQAVDKWRQLSRHQNLATLYFKGDEDPRALMGQLGQARCDAVIYTAIEPMVLGWAKAVREVPAFSGVPHVFFTPAYTQHVASALPADSETTYSMAEFEPWSSRSGTLSDWKATMGRGKVPLSSFAQGGYTAAQVFVKVLRGIEGEITRESIGAAFQRLDKLDVPMTGTPFTFGNRAAHNPNRATLPMKLSGGSWRIAHPAWIVVPE